jgi:cytochrome c-type biogenesis protein CcmH/NrfG/4-amino-4-deoxy-L-arabinose transferase-like glycosyltransferase
MAYQKFIPRCFPFLIFAAAFFLYVNTIPHVYAWDDKLVITANDYTKKGTKGLFEIFTKRVSVPYKSEYRPIPQAMFAIEYDLFNANPHVGHFFNILWYALACVMVYYFVSFSFPRSHSLFAFLVALLFVVHPLHVEVAANIKSRDEILTLFFGLSSIILLVKALERLSWRLLIAGIACFAIAFLSKTNAVTLLPVIALVAWYRSPDLKISRKLILSAGAIAICSLVLVALIRYLQNTVSDETAMLLNSTVLNNIFLWTTQPKTIIPTSLVIILRYVGLFLYPHPLIHLYGYNQIPLNSWGEGITWVVITGFLAISLIVFRAWRKKTPIMFGILFFAITYSVYSNLFFYAPDTMADRYLFIPSIGLAIILVAGVFWLAGLGLEQPSLDRIRARAVISLFGVLICAYFARTYIGNKDWANDYTLIYNRIQYMENNAAAQAIYGSMLERESVESTSLQLKHEKKVAAMKAFTRAISIYPDFYWAWVSIGRVFAERQNYDKAELAFLKAQRIEPLNAESYYYLGTLYLAMQDQDLATTYLEKAILLDPKMETAYVMLGKAYLQTNKIDNLGSMIMTARKWFPENVDIEALMATYYFRTQNYAQAVVLAKSVLAKDSNNTLAQTVLSSPLSQALLLNQGKTVNAAH